MQDEKKSVKEKAEKIKSNLTNIKNRIPKLNLKGKAASEPEKEEQKAKTKKVPKINSRDSSTGRGDEAYQTSSHSAQRKDREIQKQRQARREARKAELLKQRLIIGAVAIVILLAIILMTACPGKKHKEEPVENASATTSAITEEERANGTVPASEVRHFSFRVLLSDEMAGDNSVLTVSQFRQILQQLYDANYILVDYYSIANVKENEDGTKEFSNAKLDLPPGKIPFVLSQRDVSYSFDRIGKGYATRMVATEDGQISNDYQRADGAMLRGSFDVAPILEEFIAEHPDFAYQDARGILALTGYNGILGYRTSPMLAKTMEEGNPYAAYGCYDVNAEIEACKPVVEALKARGWHFASYGNNYCSYGAEYAMMISDVDAWMENVSGLIGGTDLMIFPCETDIGNWSAYKADNQKYQYLKGLGFDHFCIEEKNNPSWLQIRPDYVRQGIKEIDCYDDFAEIMGMQG